MRTIVRIVPILLAVTLIGCPGEARFRIAFEGSKKLKKDLTHKCADDRVKVKMGTNCYPAGQGWLVTLRLKIKNETDHLIRYDFTDALMFMDSTLQIQPDSAGLGRRLRFDYIGAMIDTTGQRAALTAESYWKTVPVGAELRFDVPFFMETWSQDSTQQLIHIRPGRLTDPGGASLCNLPAFYGDPNNGFWTPFH